MREFNELEIDAVVQGYVECALWSSTGEDDEPLDNDFDACDLSDEALSEMRDDVKDFINTCRATVRAFMAMTDCGFDQIGHDFWLTRNGHGAGFWDRGAGEAGDRLTRVCELYGPACLYVGDDGRLYFA